jgi:hypothetical protein
MTKQAVVAVVLYLVAIFPSVEGAITLQTGRGYHYPLENQPARFYNQMGDRKISFSGDFELYSTSENAGGNQHFADFVWTNNVDIVWTLTIANMVMTFVLGEGESTSTNSITFPASIEGNAIFFDVFAQAPPFQPDAPPGGISMTINSVNGENIVVSGSATGTLRSGYGGTFLRMGIPNSASSTASKIFTI